MARPLRQRVVTLGAAAGASVALLAGCGGQSGSSAPPDVRAAAQAALQLWNSFPASASSRPVVLLGSRLVPPGAGFTNQDAQLAFDNSSFRLKASSPDAATRSHGYAIAPAGQLLKTSQATLGPVLVINRITLGTASFQTDRGFVQLPAWQLYFRGGPEPISLLALAPAELFTPPTLLQPSSSAVVAVGAAAGTSDGRRVTVSFTGGLPGDKPCDVRYSSSVTSSAHAVAISIMPHPIAPGPNQACPLVVFLRSMKIQLGAPLGNRVLINGADGKAIPVAIGATRPSTATNPVSNATTTSTGSSTSTTSTTTSTSVITSTTTSTETYTTSTGASTTSTGTTT